MRYLTLQDMLWINHQVTNKVNSFDVLKLEEATFYQYGYGASQDLHAQAARFITGFLKKAPFAEGNEETARVALISFLRLNGEELTAATDWVADIAAGRAKAEDVIAGATAIPGWHAELYPDVRNAVSAV